MTRGVKFSITTSAVAARRNAIVAASGIREIQGDAALVQVGRLIDAALLVPLLDRSLDQDAEAHGVGPLERLHLDHVGSQTGQVLRAHGTGQECGEVQHPHPDERETAGCIRRIRLVPRTPRTPRIVRHEGACNGARHPYTVGRCRCRFRCPGRRSSSVGADPGARRAVALERNGGRGCGNPPRGLTSYNSRFSTCSRWGKISPVAEGNRGDPVHRPDLHDLVDRARARPIGDGLEDVRPSPIRQGLERVVVCQIGTFDHFEEGLPLRHRDGRHPDVAVADTGSMLGVIV